MPSYTTGRTTKPRDPVSVLAASTFSTGIRLLPRDLQADARQLYYMLRTVDDLVDEKDPQASHRVQAIERWANGQKTETPETRILADLSRRYTLSTQAIIEFCQGMRHDLSHTSVETEDDLERYCQYVGGTVGIMLAGLLGTSNPDGATKMAILGKAMQRTNILRDIDEDLAHGRLYIPRTTIERFGFPYPGAREALLRDQITRIDKIYDEGLDATPLLRRGARAMGLSTILYREILRQIEREGYGRARGRATVPTWRRRLLTAKHCLTLHTRPAPPTPPQTRPGNRMSNEQSQPGG